MATSAATRPTVPFGWLFLTGSMAVCAVSYVALLQPTDRAVLELGVTLDLTLLIPTLYWFLVVRGKGWPLIGILPVFLASLVLASFILPDSRQGALQVMKYLAVPAELTLVGILIHRARKAVHIGRAGACAYPSERIRHAVDEMVPNDRVAAIIGFEVSMLWYALLSWRSGAERDPVDARTYTHHEKGGYGAVVGVVLLAIAVEIIPIHALLARWSPTFAWIATGLSLYGALWLIGDFRALKLHATGLNADRLTVRFGVRWRLSVPRERIESVRVVGASAVLDDVDLRMALPGSRRLAIHLKDPVEATGPYGVRRQVRVFELGLDDPEDLHRELTGT